MLNPFKQSSLDHPLKEQDGNPYLSCIVFSAGHQPGVLPIWLGGHTPAQPQHAKHPVLVTRGSGQATAHYTSPVYLITCTRLTIRSISSRRIEFTCRDLRIA